MAVSLPCLLLAACGATSSATVTTTVTRKVPPSTSAQASQHVTTAPTATKASAAKQEIDASAAASLNSTLKSVGAKEGAVAFADLSGGVPTTYGNLSNPSGWSTIKTVILATVLQEVGGPSRLSSSQKSAAVRAITASDNDAAMSLFSFLKARHGGTAGAASRMQALLRKAGDASTIVSTKGRDGFSPYGQTLWTPAAQARFVSALERGCLLNSASRKYELGLMKQVVSDQRWGLGTLSTSYPFKGGWGPDVSGGYLVRQIGLIRSARGGDPVAVAIAVRPSNGSFATGSAALNTLARWAVNHAPKGPTEKRCA